MKKIVVLLSLVILLIGLAADLPPALPSSFYGSVNGGRAGQVVTVHVGGQVLARSTVFLWQGAPVYSLNVAMDGIAEGMMATFKVSGVNAGTAALHSGTNVQKDLIVTRLLLRR
jgi:hypothetical protein